jgi:hypothetical protein
LAMACQQHRGKPLLVIGEKARFFLQREMTRLALRDLPDPSPEWSLLGQQQTKVRPVAEWLGCD